MYSIFIALSASRAGSGTDVPPCLPARRLVAAGRIHEMIVRVPLQA